MGADPASKPAPRDLRLGRYEVVRHLATGGMGAVYLARDPQCARDVAIKVLSGETAARPGAVERFRAEALHVARLRHENIVTLHDFGEYKGVYFLVLEYVDGTDLHEYITRKGQLDPDEARHIVAQAARALHHAYKQGIVHRDIKPSNFLLTRKDGQLLVKMSDFGLARQVDNEEFHVTREGTTVGTIDYMSPEQGRDSRAADVRSDIYSLGCTLYHMLAGHAPFPEGSLTERLYKHMTEEPPNVCDANPRVPEWLAHVTRRMLAKSPADRYQTPKELLKALVHRKVEAPAREDALRTLAELELAAVKKEQKPSDGDTATAPAMPARRAAGPALRPAAARREGPAKEEGRSTPATKARRRPLLFAAAGAVVLAVGLGILLLGNRDTDKKGDRTASNDRPRDPSPPVTPADPPKKPGGTVPGTTPTPPDKITPITWPILRPDNPVVERDQLRRAFEAGWEKPPAPLPENTPVYRVCRDPRGRNEFASLADAVRAATKGGPTSPTSAHPGGDGKEPTHLVIEVQDNGPLYERPVAFAGKHVVVRAAPGYRPLVFWDAGAKPDPEPAPLFAARSGSLTLEDLDIVLQREQPPSPFPSPPGGEGQKRGRIAFARVTGGDFFARRCTFSAAGTHPAGVVLLQLEDRAAEGGAGGTSPGPAGSPRCRLHRCHARGASLVALELDGQSPDVLIDESLLSGGEAPLFEVTVREEPGPHLRLLRSTLVGRGTCLRLRGAATRPLSEPAVRWQAWDTVFARPGRASGGTMIELPRKAAPDLRWQAINCLYTGWEYLLKGPKNIAALDQAAWERFRNGYNVDRSAAEGWPALAFPEPAEASLTEYRTEATPGPPVGYAASSWPCLAISPGAGQGGGKDGPPTIGCPVSRLPAARDNWLQWTVQSFVAAPVDMLRSANVPATPAYHGERLDITQVDVGARLEQIKKNYTLGPRVVLRLFRSTDGKTVPTSPIHIKGSDLVLVLEPYRRPPKTDTTPKPPAPPLPSRPSKPERPAPKKEEEPERLVLVAEGAAAKTQAALIEVEGGSLDVIGGELTFPDYPQALVPPYLIRVRGGGGVRLHDCRLTGPLFFAPDNFKAILCLEGPASGSSQDVTTPQCGIHDCVLKSGKDAVHVLGVGARLRVEQSVVVAGSDAFVFEPGKQARPRMAVHCVLEHVTVAARQAVLHLKEVARQEPPADPIVVRALSSAFLNPFGESGGLLLYEGDGLRRGVLVWQSEGNVYDGRLRFAASTPEAIPQKSQPHADWGRLWGPSGDRRPLSLPLTAVFDKQRWQLDRLRLIPPRGETNPPDAGGDLVHLGLVKKPSRPRP